MPKTSYRFAPAFDRLRERGIGESGMNKSISSSDRLNYRVHRGETTLALDLALATARRPALSAKFGPESAVFLHLVTQRLPDIPVIRVETGYDTQATLRFVAELTERLRLNLKIFRPHAHLIRLPPALDEPDHAAFTDEVKLVPFREALAHLGVDVWLSSIRRYQSAHRRQVETFERLDTGAPRGIMKVSPMLGWTPNDIRLYAEEHDLPTGPEVFDPTKGVAFRECGLHGRLGA